MPIIDLRSDTVTKPTEEMFKTMIAAPLGDDVLGDDPTVILLQKETASLLGKEAALFVPSGTMSNQLALKAQTQPGDQIILEDGAHIYRYEGGASAALAGVLNTCIECEGGQITWDDISKSLNPDNVHCAPPSLVCLENTHNTSGGRILCQDHVEEIGSNSRRLGLRVHLDGARLWHTHVVTGISMAELCSPVDTVSVCFSKALGAPVGSVLAGDKGVIERAWRFRKMMGGGMRQAGLLAAACIFALENHIERLEADHRQAKQLATGLDHPAIKVNHPVDTNIVIMDVAGKSASQGNDEALLQHLNDHQIRAMGFGPGRVRLIPNLGTNAEQMDQVLDVLNSFPGEVN